MTLLEGAQSQLAPLGYGLAVNYLFVYSIQLRLYETLKCRIAAVLVQEEVEYFKKIQYFKNSGVLSSLWESTSVTKYYKPSSPIFFFHIPSSRYTRTFYLSLLTNLCAYLS